MLRIWLHTIKSACVWWFFFGSLYCFTTISPTSLIEPTQFIPSCSYFRMHCRRKITNVSFLQTISLKPAIMSAASSLLPCNPVDNGEKVDIFSAWLHCQTKWAANRAMLAGKKIVLRTPEPMNTFHYPKWNITWQIRLFLFPRHFFSPAVVIEPVPWTLPI